jgi:hypothetical protein
MYRTTLACLIGMTMMVSCHNSNDNVNKHPATPEALKEESSAFELITKRGGEDLVESLYLAVERNNPSLAQLRDSIASVEKTQSSAVEDFDQFISKNDQYYIAARRRMQAIKDTLLQARLKAIVDDSEKSFAASIKIDSSARAKIDSNRNQIDDLYSAVKILKTLPLMKKFQVDSKPDKAKMETYLNRQKKLLQSLDSLVKKP